MEIVKKTAEVYELRDGFAWGHIALVINGETVDVVINSDYGSYAYFWTACGKDPKVFLCQVDMHYAMNKLTSGKMYEPDTDKYQSEIKELIIRRRRDGYLDQHQAREAWDGLLAIIDEYGNGDVLFHELISSDWWGSVFFNDFDNLPSAERVKPQVSGFWEKIWIPFTQELKRELEEKQAA